MLPSAPVPGGLATLLSYLTVVIAAFAPLAAGLYLVTSTGWSVVERRLFLSRAARPARNSEGAGPPAAPNHAKRGTVVPPGRPG
jgi:YidC/Oxa1 family membrane protein insertase